MDQGSQEWLQARCGFLTASRISDVVAKTKSGVSASRKTYLEQIVAERITQKPQGPDLSNNPYVLWGKEQEPYARAMYESVYSVLVDEVGFIHHPSIKFAGASPDGLIGTDGLVELKAPATKTHLAYFKSENPPKDYYDQCMFQMAVCGRSYCDLVSYDPRVPDNLTLRVWRIDRDDEYIAMLEAESKLFLDEVDSEVAFYENIRLNR